jgi:hypothetical protein
VAINGTLVGCFQGHRGIRQEDHMFVISMEVLSKLFAEALREGFIDFHPKCSKFLLSHLCFADDLLIISAATSKSALAIKAVLAEFCEYSGLKANPSKSFLF